MASWNSPAHTGSLGLNILLLGPSRTGKSSSGNTLLGRGRVFETRGGGANTVASGISAGRHMTVVDAQGWGSSEAFVPREEKIELLRALDLFESGGPHVILLVIPLSDFTEPERRAVEKRMEVLNSTVWRHTMVLFTFGDWLRRSGQSVQQHIQSGGPALQWLMEKCRYRYHVLDNKTATIAKHERLKEVVKKERGGLLKKEAKKVSGRKDNGGDTCKRGEGEQEQVKELLSKVEDMLQENGGWHFSLHMYQRLEEEWSCRERKLRARLEQERHVERVSSKEETIETEEEQEEGGVKEPENEGGRKEKMERRIVDGKINTEEDEERVKLELRRQSSEEEGWDTSSDSGGEREEGRRVLIEGEHHHNQSTDVKTGMPCPYWPNGGQRLAFSPIKGLA